MGNMAEIEIVRSLVLDIIKKFNPKEGNEILDLMNSVSKSPRKGKPLGTVAGIVIKELKYRNFRFYFIADGYKMKFLKEDDLVDLLIRFVRMSDKKHQEGTIKEIKRILISIGPKGFG